MRSSRRGWRWVGAFLLALSGCHTDPPLKPDLPEEYRLPPSDDSRFSSPPAYPKETLDSGTFKKDQQRNGDSSRGSTGFGGPGGGMGRGMGGY